DRVAGRSGVRLCRRADDCLEPHTTTAAPQVLRRSQPTGKYGTHSQDHQRQSYDRGRLMNMRSYVFIRAAAPVKDHEKLAKHVKGGYACRHPGDKPELVRSERTAVGLP